MTIPSDACGIEKWSDFFPVCGKIVVKRKITAKLAVIFLELVDSKGIEPSTSAMRTQRSREVVSFLPTDCGMWGAYIM